MSPPTFSPIQKIFLSLLSLLMKALLRLEVIGLENIPAAGPVVIIINHIAFLDPLMVCAVSPRLVIPMAKKEAFDSFLWRPFLKLYGAIPVQRGEADTKAVKAALQFLRQQGVILMAPEGTRSITYQLQPGKEGAAMIALRGEAVIVPIGITGTHQIRANLARFKRAPVRLVVGRPFRLRSTSANHRSHRSETAAMTQELMYRLARQLPPEFRGVYANLEEATEAYLRPVELVLPGNSN
ncbi:MAG: 1-acyl-sn-glycerol-3-phosphate acyltransferase [Anaerolineae bacterium]|nr:1-acyl-sn-glycerol-3-phosphate acyltransferase [Anaerolineae bacterium]